MKSLTDKQAHWVMIFLTLGLLVCMMIGCAETRETYNAGRKAEIRPKPTIKKPSNGDPEE